MNLKKHTILGGLTLLAFVGVIPVTCLTAAEEPNDQGAEVQTRGPVHEAFAGTVSFDPEVGMIVDKAPPALIEEVPPEQRLEGENVTWIPGYWAWDEEQDDFLWISGIWRNLPPGRQWVPGYWADADGRYQWTSGYWEDEATTEVAYLPEPPHSVEAGPNIEASSNDQSWIPGNWIWRNERYAWRAGYWTPARENWSWVPAYYRWSRRGYIYVDGFWDYPVARRGVVFAPVRFQRAYISRPGFFYSPITVISLNVFANHLFLRPSHCHYYFGDYYEPRYRTQGFFASYSYNSGHRGYDPIFAHYRWENRNDRNWENGRRDYFEYRRDHADARPPRTWVALNARPQGERDRGDFDVAQRFDRVVGNHAEGGQRFQSVNQQDRERYVSQSHEIRKFGDDRVKMEARGTKPEGKNQAVSREKINHSPVAAKKSDRSDKDGGPPERLQPRASEMVEKTGKSDQAGHNPKSNGEDPPKTKRPKEGTADRESDPGSKGKGKTDAPPETRVKPGEKREKAPAIQGKEKRQADPNPEPKAKPSEKRQADPTPERQADPTPKHRTDSNPEPKAKPAEKRQADPTPKRQADPAPQHPKPAANGEPQVHPKKNPNQGVVPTDGLTDEQKKRRAKKQAVE